MTPEELDDWIVQKTDTQVIMSKMRGGMPLTGLAFHYYVNLLEDDGMNRDMAGDMVRHSLVRLLRAGRIHAVGISSWSTVNGPATAERIWSARDVVEGRAELTHDLRGRPHKRGEPWRPGYGLE